MTFATSIRNILSRIFKPKNEMVFEAYPIELNKAPNHRNVKIKKCSKCKEKFKGYTDIFYCKYCRKYFCSNHRLPENHRCSGNPKPLPTASREIYSREKRTVSGVEY